MDCISNLMDLIETLKENLKRHEELGIELVTDKEIKKFGTTAHIILPKKYIGWKAKIIITR